MSIRLIADVVNQLGSPALYSNSLANRPPAGFGGRLFISSDTHEIYQDVITGWNLIADAGAGAGTLDSVTHNGNTTTWGINILGGDLTLQATQKLYVLGLSNGGVLFPSGGSGLISQDTTNFVWDNTNKYLGIGTNAPTAPFDIHSGSNVMQQLNSTGTNNSFLAFLNQDVGKWRIGNLYGGGNNDMVIYDTANSTYRAYFTNTGYTILPNSVIIGSSSRSSSYILDVTGNSSFTGTIRNTGAAYFATSGGNVGINTISPVSLLHLQSGNLTIAKTAIGNGTEVGNITFRNDYMGAYEWAAIKGVNGSTQDFSNIAFYTTYGFNSSTERARISSLGNVLINTVSDNGYKLQVNGNASISGAITSQGNTISSYFSQPSAVANGSSTSFVYNQTSAEYQVQFQYAIVGLSAPAGSNISCYASGVVTFFADGAVNSNAINAFGASNITVGSSSTNGGVFTLTFTNISGATMSNINIRIIKLNRTNAG
jgi:hypothetical protein